MFCKIPHCDQNHKDNPNNLHDHILNHGHHCSYDHCHSPHKYSYMLYISPKNYLHTPPLKSPNYKRHNSDTNTAKMGMKNFLFAYRKKRTVTLFSIVSM